MRRRLEVLADLSKPSKERGDAVRGVTGSLEAARLAGQLHGERLACKWGAGPGHSLHRFVTVQHPSLLKIRWYTVHVSPLSAMLCICMGAGLPPSTLLSTRGHTAGAVCAQTAAANLFPVPLRMPPAALKLLEPVVAEDKPTCLGPPDFPQHIPSIM